MATHSRYQPVQACIASAWTKANDGDSACPTCMAPDGLYDLDAVGDGGRSSNSNSGVGTSSESGVGEKLPPAPRIDSTVESPQGAGTLNWYAGKGNPTLRLFFTPAFQPLRTTRRSDFIHAPCSLQFQVSFSIFVLSSPYTPAWGCRVLCANKAPVRRKRLCVVTAELNACFPYWAHTSKQQQSSFCQGYICWYS